MLEIKSLSSRLRDLISNISTMTHVLLHNKTLDGIFYFLNNNIIWTTDEERTMHLKLTLNMLGKFSIVFCLFKELQKINVFHPIYIPVHNLNVK